MKYLSQGAIAILPTLSIFLVGRLFPMDPKESRPDNKPPFQPPSYVFGIVWTYLTIALGAVTAYVLHSSASTGNKRNVNATFKPTIVLLFFSLLGCLNGWLPLFYYKRYAECFWLLVFTTYLSVAYLVTLAYARINPIAIAALAPLSMWLVLATALNGTKYTSSPL